MLLGTTLHILSLVFHRLPYLKSFYEIAAITKGFRLIYLFEKPVYNYVFCMFKDDQLDSDLGQKNFITIYKNLKWFRGNARLSPWIYKITTKDMFPIFPTTLRAVFR